MELFSAEFFSALLAIILIDLVLAGDNALVIGLVARRLPKEDQKKVIMWGTVGAIAIRAVMAITVVYLLKIPGFLLIGGLALIWIARKLVQPNEGGHDAHGKEAPTTVGAAIRTVVIADAVMGIDNVLGIGGVARDSILLIVIGLAISVPIIVWGSQLVLKLVDRFPIVILIGGAVLAWTSVKMIMEEPMLHGFLARSVTAQVALTVLVLAISIEPWVSNRLTPRHRPLAIIIPGIVMWLLGFQLLADHYGWEMKYLDAHTTGDALLQFARWVGWLPFALAYLTYERRVRRQQMRPAPTTVL